VEPFKWAVIVESEINGGEGLDVTPCEPRPGTETTSSIDSTPVGEYPPSFTAPSVGSERMAQW
jgi:hypothetical protein